MLQTLNYVALIVDIIIWLVLVCCLFGRTKDDEFVIFDTATGTPETLTVVTTRDLYIILVAVFTISIIFDLLRIWGVGYDLTTRNVLRWLEFSVSTTLILIIVAIVSGVRSFGSLWLLIIINISVMGLSATLDRYNDEWWYKVVLLVQTILITGAHLIIYYDLVFLDSNLWIVSLNAAAITFTLMTLPTVQFIMAFYQWSLVAAEEVFIVLWLVVKLVVTGVLFY